jgi:hypothetical protein
VALEEVYTCDCGNQAWFITGDKIVCVKCRIYHILLSGSIISASEFNKLKTTFKVRDDIVEQERLIEGIGG